MTRSASEFRLITLMAFFCGILSASARPEIADGVAIITSYRGSVQIVAKGSPKGKAKLHSIMPLSETRIETDRAESLFFSLSNNTALGINEKSKLTIEHYRQLPYESKKESIEYEPSRSRLLINLEAGSIAIAANGLSPLSEIIVRLPQGKVHIYSSVAYIRHSTEGLHLSVTEGNLTYVYPKSDEREVIAAPNSLRISDEDALAGKEATLSTDQQLGKQAILLVKATEHSRRRVIHKVHGSTASIPTPVLVAVPKNADQIPPRPYNFLD